MKERPILFSGPMVAAILAGRKTQTRRICKLQSESDYQYGGAMWTERQQIDRCPYGKHGDRLWVKEKWAILQGLGLPLTTPQPLHYMADITDRRQIEDYTVKPSIHMPRWASRITLEVTGVRVERLQDISEADAKAEGCTPLLPVADERYRPAYHRLWDEINGPGSWAANPWVWVVEFLRVTT